MLITILFIAGVLTLGAAIGIAWQSWMVGSTRTMGDFSQLIRAILNLLVAKEYIFLTNRVMGAQCSDQFAAQSMEHLIEHWPVLAPQPEPHKPADLADRWVTQPKTTTKVEK